MRRSTTSFSSSSPAATSWCSFRLAILSAELRPPVCVAASAWVSRSSAVRAYAFPSPLDLVTGAVDGVGVLFRTIEAGFAHAVTSHSGASTILVYVGSHR
jgi:hypothetical protein